MVLVCVFYGEVEIYFKRVSLKEKREKFIGASTALQDI